MRRKHSLFLFLLFAPMFFLIGCSDDEDSVQDLIVGTWQLQSVQENGQDVSITGLDNAMRFQSNSIFIRYNTTTAATPKRGGWSYEGDMLNISLDLPAAYYVINLNSTELRLKKLGFFDNGDLKTTELVYTKVEDSVIPE